VTIYRDGEKWKSAEGDLLEFDTQVGSRYLILPGQATPESVRHAVP
jgi:hypothetical protein